MVTTRRDPFIDKITKDIAGDKGDIDKLRQKLRKEDRLAFRRALGLTGARRAYRSSAFETLPPADAEQWLFPGQDLAAVSERITGFQPLPKMPVGGLRPLATEEDILRRRWTEEAIAQMPAETKIKEAANVLRIEKQSRRETKEVPLTRIPWTQTPEEQARYQLPEPRTGIGYALDILTGRKTTDNPEGLNPVEYAVQFPASEAAVTWIPMIATLGVAAYQGIPSLIALTKEIPDKVLQAALNTGLDGWIARRSRGVPPQFFQQAQNILFNLIAKDRVWLQQRATENMLRRMGRGVNQATAARQTVDDVVSDFEARLSALIPRGTQTGAMAFGGKRAGLTPDLWNSTPVAQRVINAQSVGLSGQVGSKAFEQLTQTEITALSKIAPIAEAKEAVPVKGTPAPEVTKPIVATLNPDLISEAKKYKSASDFAKEGEYGIRRVRLSDVSLEELQLLRDSGYNIYYKDLLTQYAEGIDYLGLDPSVPSTFPLDISPLKYKEVKSIPIKQRGKTYNPALASVEAFWNEAVKKLKPAIPEAEAAEAPRISEAKVKVEPIPARPKPEAPAAEPLPAERVEELAEQVKAKVAIEPQPVVAKVTRETPTTAKQFVTALEDINTELEAWRASLKGLRKDNAAEARKAIRLLETEVKNAKAIISEKIAPGDIKAMRQQVMAIAHFKGIPKTQTQAIFKRVTGKTGLTKMTETQLADVLKAVKEARPKTIKGKRVITEATEKAIQSLKKTLIDGNYLNEQAYQQIRASLRLKTDKYITPRLFIGEREARELIRTMNSEAEVGLLKHETELVKALENQPELAAIIKDLSDRSMAEAVLSINKGVKVSPLWDMWVYTEKLQNRTGEPFYDIYRMMLDIKLANITKAEAIQKEIMDSTPDYKKIAADKKALKRVNDYLASKLGEKVKVSADMTEGEIALAKQIEKTLFSFQNPVRYYRFMTAYDAYEGDITKMAADIPNAPRADLREAVKIYESGGATQLSAYLNTKDWGVIKTGYEPHIVVNPKLQLRRIKATILSKGMLKTREGIQFNAGEKTILDRTHTYIHRMLNLELEPYLKKLDRTLQKASPKLRAGSNTAEHLSLMVDEMKGTFYISEPLARYIARAGGYATSVVYLAPHLGFRNLWQPLAMYPDRTALIDPRNSKLSPEALAYLGTYVNQGRQFTQQFLLQGELGTGHVANLLRRISFMGISESINNMVAFWAGVNKGTRALEAYQKTKDIGKFINASGMKDLTLRQQKEVLELMALGKEQEAVWLIGRKINQNTNMIYDRAQGAPVTMGTSGRLLGSLLNFTRGYGQRVAQQLGKMGPGHTWSETRHAFKILAGLVIFGILAGELYKKVTGKKQNPYNPLTMLTWSPGGLAVGATADTADVIGDIMLAVTGDKEALNRLPIGLVRSGDLLIPFYSTILNILESASATRYVDRLALRKVLALIRENYKPDEEFYQKERNWIGRFQHALFGGEQPEPVPFKEAQRLIPEAISKLGKIDQIALDDALKQATKNKASPAKIAEIKAKDWTFDINSLRRDISDAIRGLTDKEIAQLPPVAVAYSGYVNQKDAYDDLSTKEQVAYLKVYPDFVANRLFWGELTEIPDLKAAEAVEAQAKKFGISLDMLPAFQKTDKGNERIPSDRYLWEDYFDYYDLPGDGDWRANYRRSNFAFDQWLQDNKGMQPLPVKKTITVPKQGVRKQGLSREDKSEALRKAFGW